MSIATEIQRLQTAKADIKTAIENKGVTVGDGTIDTYANLISQIIGGVGGLRHVRGTVTFTNVATNTITHNLGTMPKVIMVWIEPETKRENATLGAVYTSATPVALNATFEDSASDQPKFYALSPTATQGIKDITETTFGLQRRVGTYPIKTGVEYNWLAIV